MMQEENHNLKRTDEEEATAASFTILSYYLAGMTETSPNICQR
jgi:hypothetical protein